jgi:hypothetical protein
MDDAEHPTPILNAVDLIAREIWKNTEATLPEAQDVAADCLNALSAAGLVVVPAQNVGLGRVGNEVW